MIAAIDLPSFAEIVQNVHFRRLDEELPLWAIGVPILFLGAVLYFLGRRNSNPKP